VDVVSIATLYETYPVVLIVPEDSDIATPADLAGRTVGIPGPFGETYFGLLAMLDGAGLSESDLTIEHIGYTQQSALTSGHVDAVMGFVNNDVPQFRAGGLPVRSVPIGDVPLVGISLGTTDELTDAEADALTGVVTAVGRAVADIVADPQVAVEASGEHIPGAMTPDQEEAALQTVEATVELYGQTGDGWGTQDDATWSAMADFMLDTGLISAPVPADEAYTNAFVAGG
jgi:NitT/TauT family transport system substrate-binding protein